MKRRFVILNEVKNLIGSMPSVGEILRLHLRMTLRYSRLMRNPDPPSIPPFLRGDKEGWVPAFPLSGSDEPDARIDMSYWLTEVHENITLPFTHSPQGRGIQGSPLAPWGRG